MRDPRPPDYLHATAQESPSSIHRPHRATDRQNVRLIYKHRDLHAADDRMPAPCQIKISPSARRMRLHRACFQIDRRRAVTEIHTVYRHRTHARAHTHKPAATRLADVVFTLQFTPGMAALLCVALRLERGLSLLLLHQAQIRAAHREQTRKGVVSRWRGAVCASGVWLTVGFARAAECR